MSIFSVIGVAVFGTTRAGERLSDTAHFRDFASAMLTLFQCMNGDDWMVCMCIHMYVYAFEKFVCVCVQWDFASVVFLCMNGDYWMVCMCIHMYM